jgi:hypothetical protein
MEADFADILYTIDKKYKRKNHLSIQNSLKFSRVFPETPQRSIARRLVKLDVSFCHRLCFSLDRGSIEDTNLATEPRKLPS